MQDKPKTARFGTTLFLDNPLHRQAWEILSAIPAGQRTNWLCLALCQQAQREQFLLDLKTILQTELQNSSYSGDSSAIFCRSVDDAENNRSAASAYPSCFSRTTALRISPAVNVVPNISRAVSGSLCASSTMTVQASGRMGFKPFSRCIQSASQRFWLQIWNRYRFCPHSVKCRR